MTPQPKPPRRATAGPTLLLATALLAGCSPYRYSTQVDTFAKGITGFADSVAKGEASGREDQLALVRQKRLHSRPTLDITAGCDAIAVGATLPCVVTPPDPPAAAPAAPVASEPTAAQVAQALRAYAAALQAITNAKDREDLDKASKAVTAAFGKIPKVIAPQAEALSTVFSAGLWLFGQALDFERLNALKTGVHSAQQPVDQLVASVVSKLRTQKQERIQTLFAMAITIRQQLPTAKGRSDWLGAHDDLVATAAAIETVRKIDPDATAAALQDTHSKLDQALQNPKPDLEEIQKAAEAFLEKAQAASDAFEKLRKQ